ncbi:unnamed protein product [Rhodiola kirilowii]
MVPELEKPRVTEIQVRMDCQGCIQKVKKALNGINGIYDVYINYPEQKVTVMGWADPEKIMKAIRKTRKTATMCAHFEPEAAEQPAEGAPPQGPDEANPPPPDGGPTEPPQAQPPPPLDNPHQVTLEPGQPLNQPGPEEVQSVPVIYHQPLDSYRNNGSGCTPELNHFQHVPEYVAQPRQHIEEAHHYISYRPAPQMYTTQRSPQVRATHNYNTQRPVLQTYASLSPLAIQESHSYQLYTPSPHTYIIQPQHMPATQPPKQVQEPQRHCNFMSSPQPQAYISQQWQLNYSPSANVIEYDYIPSLPAYTPYNHMGRYYDDYSNPCNSSNGDISSMFSDENPNACTIM